MKYLHISQHWCRTIIINGFTYKTPERLDRVSQLEVLIAEPFKVKFEINENKTPNFGESVYQINADQTLTFIGGNYDTSD